MRPHDVHEAIETLWKELPLGLGKDFNTVLNYVDLLEMENR